MENDLERFLAQCIQEPGVRGVILTGSTGRGDGDEYSDTDIVILTDHAISGITEGKQQMGVLTLDIRFVPWDVFPVITWSMAMYFAYLYGRVVYDPTERVAAVIAMKRMEWEQECSRSLYMLFTAISFIQPSNRVWRGVGGQVTHFDRFLQRRDVGSAHRLVLKAADLMLEAVYLINHVPVPDYKNGLRCLRLLQWLPKDFRMIIGDVMSPAVTPQELREKSKALSVLLEVLHEKAEKTFNLPDDLYKYHLTHRCVT